MGVCLSSNKGGENVEERQRSQAIDKRIEEDAKRLSKECKILLLGAGESGKSTIVKQMKIIHQNGYTQDELRNYRSTVYKNLLECAGCLIKVLQDLNVQISSTKVRDSIEFLSSYHLDPDPHIPIDSSVGEAITLLWSDPCITRIVEHQNELYIMDSAPYMFDNRMNESLILFDSVINSRWFMRTSIVLFLNKVDLFRAKIERSPLSNYFPEYSGGNDPNRAAKFLLWKFTQVNRAHLTLYPQYVDIKSSTFSHLSNWCHAKSSFFLYLPSNFYSLTQATDTSNIRLVFSVVKETILQNALRDSGIL
ncbi:Guanine nucleotide-binding protein alpha-2 subunit [Ascosphaera aggregata]|nr:Guanine nucleotide-binding protein alpha-2 subunit [Ascosphaera aggregata]